MFEKKNGERGLELGKKKKKKIEILILQTRCGTIKCITLEWHREAMVVLRREPRVSKFQMQHYTSLSHP